MDALPGKFQALNINHNANHDAPESGGEISDPITNLLSTSRKVQPYQARKLYLCPGCQSDILVGQGHYVVIPNDDPSARRHWHETCLKRALKSPHPNSTKKRKKRRKLKPREA